MKRSLLSSLRATLKISGSMTTSPTSKNMGMPITKATRVIAQGIMRSDVRCRMALASRSVVPESARILPSMAPRAMTTPTAPSVLPAPLVRFLTISPGAMPVAKPTPMETTSSASKG